MPQAVHLEDLSAALAVSEEMVVVANGEDWSRLLELQSKRHDLIRSAFAKPIPSADAHSVAAVVARIQGLNQSLIALGNRRREKLAGALSTLSTGRRARSAYAGASRS